MSGLEILGIAASVVQIADLGARLSVQLIGFSRKVKEANKNIEAISQEIAVTGAVLQELGAELKKDDNKSGCSRRALQTAEKLITACKDIFKEISAVIEPSGSTTAVAWRQRLKYPFFESKLTLLRTKLESLKSSLLVILNVLVYAEQVRNREALPILKEQQLLLQLLVEDKRTNEAKVRHALEGAQPYSNPPAPAYEAERDGPIAITLVQEPPKEESQLTFLGSEVEKELLGHCLFVEKMLRELEQPQYSLSTRLAGKVQESVLAGHWGEWSYLSRIHGHERLLSGLSKNKAVHSYWIRCNADQTIRAPSPRPDSLQPRPMMNEANGPSDARLRNRQQPNLHAILEKDLYTILDVPHTASDADIEKNFRLLVLKYHPDRNPGRESEVLPLFNDAQVARDTLKDPKMRAKYDRLLQRRTAYREEREGENARLRSARPREAVVEYFAPPPIPSIETTENEIKYFYNMPRDGYTRYNRWSSSSVDYIPELRPRTSDPERKASPADRNASRPTFERRGVQSHSGPKARSTKEETERIRRPRPRTKPPYYSDSSSDHDSSHDMRHPQPSIIRASFEPRRREEHRPDAESTTTAASVPDSNYNRESSTPGRADHVNRSRNDGNPYYSRVEELCMLEAKELADDPVSHEIHELIIQFGGFRDEDLSKLLDESVEA